MSAGTHGQNVGHPRSDTLAFEREPGLLSGLASLLPRLGYTGVLPSVNFEGQERPLAGLPSSSQSRASSAGSDSSSADSEAVRRQESTALLNTAYAEPPETSTSGRNGQDSGSAEDNTAAAAERHRLGTGSNIDLQVTILNLQLFYAQGSLWQQTIHKKSPASVSCLKHAGYSTLGGKDSSISAAAVCYLHIHTF